MPLPYGPLHYWMVALSFRRRDSSCRSNRKLGVVAPTIEAAIAVAKQDYTPEEDCIVFNCSHQGAVNVICDKEARTGRR